MNQFKMRSMGDSAMALATDIGRSNRQLENPSPFFILN